MENITMKVINTQICSATGYKELMKYEQSNLL